MTVYAIVISNKVDKSEKLNGLGLSKGSKHKVEKIHMGQSNTTIQLTEYPNHGFNSTLFSFEEDSKELDIFSDSRFNPYINIFKGD